MIHLLFHNRMLLYLLLPLQLQLQLLSSLYYIHHGDNPDIMLVTRVFIGDDFHT